MTILPHGSFVRSVALAMSLLMVFQSIACADPDLLSSRQDRLVQQTLFTARDDVNGLARFSAKYLMALMTAAENDPANRNIFRIKEQADEAVSQLVHVYQTTGSSIKDIPKVKGSPESGEVLIDGGLFIIRYFHPGIQASMKPESPYRLAGKDRILGNYLMRQVVVNENGRFEELIRFLEEEERSSASEKEDKDDSKAEEDRPESRDSGAGYSAARVIWERLGIRHYYFSVAPVFEELFKIGFPFAAFYLLDVVNQTIPSLNMVVFQGLLSLLAMLFVTVHLWNTDKKELPALGEGARLLAAPFIVATGGIMIALCCVEQPALAIGLSIFLHLLTNIAVAGLKKMGYGINYASLSGRGRDFFILQIVQKMAEGQKFLVSQYDTIKKTVYQRFGVDIQTEEFKSVRVELAKMCAVQNAMSTTKRFEMFGLDASRDPEIVAEIATLCARRDGEYTAMYFGKFGFDPARHKKLIADIAYECARNNGSGTARYFRSFGLSAAGDLNDVVRIAYACAEQNGDGTARFFGNFGLSAARGGSEADAVKHIAYACATQNAAGTANYFPNFGFDARRDSAAVAELALICAKHHSRCTAKYLGNFGIDPASMRDAAMRVASVCASWDPDSFMEYYENFGLWTTREEALLFCRNAERDNISDFAGRLRHTFLTTALSENGQTALSEVDRCFDSLDVTGLSMGSQAYIRALLLEEAAKRGDISGDFRSWAEKQVIPGLRALESITAGYPSMGIEFRTPGDVKEESKWREIEFRVVMSNYLARGKTPSEMGRSYLWQDGKRQIRVPPAPYPVMRLLVSKMRTLGLVQDGEYRITVAGDYMEEALFLFAVLHYASTKPLNVFDDPGVRGKPWVKGGHTATTVDPWTGRLLGEDDEKTRGTQTQFFLWDSTDPIEKKMDMTFTLISAAAAYLGRYGVKDERLRTAYEKMRGEIKAFLSERMKVGKGNINRLFPELRRFDHYDFDLKEAEMVLRDIGARLKENVEDDETESMAKEKLYQDLKDLVRARAEDIRSRMIAPELDAAIAPGLKEDFGAVRQAVLSACFNGNAAVRGTALKVAKTAYKDEYEKITAAEKKTRRDPSGEARAIIDNAGLAVPSLVNAMMGLSEKNESIVIAIDLDVGEGDISGLLKELADMLPSLGDNNEELERFFRNIEVVKGRGKSLADRMAQITDPRRGGVKAENVIVVTSSGNLAYYANLEGRATLAALENQHFPQDAYLPLLEVLLFAAGKHLGWDEGTLKRYYEMIPNVIPFEKLDEKDLKTLFGDEKTLIIRLIPDAVVFSRKELRDLIDGIKTILSRA